MAHKAFTVILAVSTVGLIIAYILTLTHTQENADSVFRENSVEADVRQAADKPTNLIGPADPQGLDNKENGSMAQNSQPRSHLAADSFNMDHLVLLGTAKTAADTPYAIIRNSRSGGQDLYRTGSTIEGAKIVRIGPDRVLLDKGGSQCTLYLSRSRTRVDQAARLPAGHDLPPRDFSKPDISQIESGWAAVQQLMSDIELNPHTQNGYPEGVVVAMVASGSVFDAAGLEPDDVIRSINGKMIRIPDDAMEIYESFRTAETIDIKVTRKGRPMTLHYIP